MAGDHECGQFDIWVASQFESAVVCGIERVVDFDVADEGICADRRPRELLTCERRGTIF